MPFPDFVIIGAMKAGTSSLHEYLDAHPDIGMSTPKETDYFITEFNYSKGATWYHGCFPSDRLLYGESSVNYTKAHAFAGVPARIFNSNPAVKLIYVLRDPIARLVSHYHHQFVAGMEERPIDEALGEATGNHYLETSLYHFQLGGYLEHFDPSAIHIATAEALRADRQRTVATICEFLGVAEHDVTNASETHRSAEKKMRPAFARAIGSSKLKEFVRPFVPRALLDAYKSKTEFEPPAQELSNAVAAELEARLAPDVAALRRFSGRDFAEWPRGYQA